MSEDRNVVEPVGPPVPSGRKANLPSSEINPVTANVATNPPSNGHGAQSDDGHNEDDGSSDHPATLVQKILVALFLVITTVPLLYASGIALKEYQSGLNREVKAKWEQPGGVVLKSGPTTFRYDKEQQMLFYRGPMSQKDKEQLAALASNQLPEPSGSPASKEAGNSNAAARAKGANLPANQKEVGGKQARDDVPSQAGVQSFVAAISELAYLANGEYHFLLYLLLLAGLGGAVGTQLRCTANFINTCINGRIDVVLYWPLYVLRPLMGFVVGVIVVVLVKGRFFMADSNAEGDLWWLGLAVIVGFGAQDFTERLRLIGQTILGSGSAKPKVVNQKGEAPKKDV